MRSVLLAVLLVATMGSTAQGQVYSFETATLGPTGQGAVGSFSLDDLQYLGAKFEITKAVHVSSVGGHIGSILSGDMFAAIVPLDAGTDLPATFDMSDALATRTFTPPGPSDEVVVSMGVDLSPGRYALVFGAGLFGTTGMGFMPPDNAAIGTPETFYGDALFSEYHDRVGIPDDKKLRFFVDGTVQVSSEPFSWGSLKSAFDTAGGSEEFPDGL